MALEHAWNQAEPLKDLKALDVLFDNGMTYVDSDGTLMTKAEFLAHVKSGGVVQVVTESMTVRIFDNTAIATGIYRAKAVKDGKPIFLRGPLCRQLGLPECGLDMCRGPVDSDSLN